MEGFLSRATMLLLVIVLGCILAIPILGQVVFADGLPERWRFGRWPLWLQIPFGLIVVLYLIADVWLTIRPPGKKHRKNESSPATSQDSKPPA